MIKRLNFLSQIMSYRANLIFAIIIILGLLLSCISSYMLYNNEIERKFSELSQSAKFDNIIMKHTLENTIEAVRSITKLYSASDYVSRMEFDRFSSVEILYQKNIQAVSWVPRVNFSQRKLFEAAARSDGLVNFSITEKSKVGVIVNADQRDEYYPVFYIYPSKGNEAAIGFDLASNPSRLATLNKARDSGELQFTPRLTLIQEAGNSYGILVVLPIYNNINIPKSITDRQDEIKGFATGVLRISDILLNPSKDANSKSYVFDLSANKGQQVLFPKGSDIQDLTDIKLEACIKTPIQIGGRTWISAHCDKQFFNLLKRHLTSVIVFLALSIITVIVAFYLRYAIQQENERKEASGQIIQASKLATLGEMATSVAHELNQPLNVIRMAAGNSRRMISKGTATCEYLNAKLERIEEQTARAAVIIDHMRVFGREAKEEVEPIAPRVVVTNALDLMAEQLRLAGIEIVTEFSKDCPAILGHSIQMEQVILNLLTNALDAMAKSAGDKKITLRVFADDKGVHITAEDTGGGIPEDALPRIFEPFFTTKEMGKGTGLGLSVSYGIINDMNGTLVADNIDGGARFTITLPRVS
jgi:signal transduction histidine kinase